MKRQHIVVAVSLLATIGMGAVPAAAQNMDPEAQALISDPLENYTLDVMIPARSADEVSAYMSVAKNWVEASELYKATTKKARELVKTRLAVKQLAGNAGKVMTDWEKRSLSK